MIRTFMFDLGNVLLHFSHERMCAQMGALCEKSAEEIRELLFDTPLQHDFDRGSIGDEEFHRRFVQEVEKTVSIDELRHAASDIFTLNTPMPAILDALKLQGHRLVLLSNTNSAHIEFVARNFDILDQFDEMVLSHKVGATKPDAVIFEAALEKIDCEPEACFYTDDIAAYVEAAREFGLRAEVFTDAICLVDQLSRLGIEIPMRHEDE